MMLLYLRQLADELRYPYAPETLRADYPNTSFPWPPPAALLAEYGVFPVMDRDPPAYDPLTHDVEEAPPALVAGSWTRQWRLVAVAAPEAMRRRAAWRARSAVSPRQARLALSQAGLLAAVTAWIASADATTQIEWEFALEVRRDWPPILACGAALGLSEAQLDALFAQAAEL